ncbi:MAG: TetR/AcrR family transcriptional regulator [bacterium]|nr:TetR/AcrR family transcriptional regulator [bacterium]
MAVAMRVFREKGYHAASMQEIAHAVGMQKGSLYYYISSKQELLFKIFEEAIGSMARTLEEIYAGPGSPREKLRQAIAAHVHAISQRLDMLTIFLRETKVLSPTQEEIIDIHRLRYERLLQRLVSEGMKAGELRRMDSKLVTYALLGMTNWIYRWYNPSGRFTPDEIADIFAELVFNGLAEREE